MCKGLSISYRRIVQFLERMKNMSEKKERWKLGMILGAVISYNVGAGFASGNEILQFYACWDKKGMVTALLCGCFVTMWSLAVIFLLGHKSKEQEGISGKEVYQWSTGKIPGKIFRLVTDIMVLGCFMLMFSGAGNVLQQQFSMPFFLGGLLLAVVTLMVVLGGLKKVEVVLGYAGIAILAYVAIFAFYTLFGGKSSVEHMALIPEAVAQGKVYCANVLALFPFSIFPQLASYNTPALEGILYATECIMAGFPFFFTLGKKCGSKREAIGTGIFSGLAFYLCIVFVMIILAFNFDAVIDPNTGEMFAFPALAAVKKLWRAGGFTYSLLIFAGIFSSAIGYLWVIKERVFPQEEGTRRSHLFTILVVMVGMLVGNRLPFSQLINFLFPIVGIAGLFMVLLITVFQIRR